jgi:hypothetical protein
MAIDTTILANDIQNIMTQDGLSSLMAWKGQFIRVFAGDSVTSDDLQDEGFFRDSDRQVSGQIRDLETDTFFKPNELAVLETTTYRIMRVTKSSDGVMFGLELKRATA